MTKTRGLLKLKFQKKIVPSVEEPIPTKELVARLKELLNELSSVDQENVDPKSLDLIKDQLVNKKLIRNNNLAVQSYVACCLSDILRIYAPDAPYTAGQLSDIFKLFFNQFKRLNDQDSNGCFNQYFYLLSKLSEVRSIILITDLPDSEKLIESIFEIFYNLAKQPNFPLKLEPLICDILSEIVSESDSIPPKVLKLILNKFLNENSPLAGMPNTVNPSLNFSLSICNTNADRMSRLITQFFSEIIYEGSHNGNDPHSAQFIDSLKKLHKLSIEVWKHIPELLASVMGLIEDELDAEDVTIRLMATETVSKIIAVQPSKLNFTQNHSDSYTSWLKKTLDMSSAVRCKWVETTLPILLSSKQDLSDIISGLTKSLLDTDEKVRFVTCRTLAKLPSRLFLDKIANETIMKILSQLIREKHPETRTEIIKLLGNLYDDCWEEEKNNKLLSWIPEHVLNLIYINDRNINALVDLCLLEKLIPFENDATKRVDRMLFVMSQLSEKAKSSFFAILKRQQQVSNVMLQFLKLCETYNGGQVLEDKSEKELRLKLDKIVNWLSLGLLTYLNTELCLERFITLNNRRFYKLIKLCLSSDSDYETIKMSLKELFNKLNDAKTIKVEKEIAIPPSDMLNVFKLLMYRASLILVNKSNVPLITEIAKDTAHPLNGVAEELSEIISVNVPGVFKSHIHELTNFVIGADGKGRAKYSQTLKTIYQFLKQYQDFNEQLSIEFYDACSNLATTGSVLESRYSVKIICLSRHKYSYTDDIFNACYPLRIDDAHFTTHLAAIAELYLAVPQLLEEASSDITSFLIKEILLVNREKAEQNESQEWIDDGTFELGEHQYCQQKLLALSIFTNRLISLETTDEAKTHSLVEPVIKLFMSLIGNGGEIVKSDVPTPKNYQTKLRLAAGVYLLEISKVALYSKMITPAIINRLVFLVQDECKEVRSEFMKELQRSLFDNSISELFLPLVFFLAHEPEDTLKSNIKTWVRSSFSKKSVGDLKSLVYERSFVRFLHMVTHQQEYQDLMNEYFVGNSEDSLIQAYSFSLEYICFFLGLIANQDNVSLLYYFTSRLKQYRDHLIPSSEYDQFYEGENKSKNSPMFNLYRIAELAQLTVKELSHHKSWILSTYPGNFKLPGDLFSGIKSQEEAQYVVQTVFIEDSVANKLNALVRSKVGTIVGHTIKRSLKDNSNIQSKKVKTIAKTKKKSVLKSLPQVTGPVRKSSRNADKNVNYAADDDDEMEFYNDENEE